MSTLDIPRTHPDVVLPAKTLIFDQHGTHVAVVGEGEKVKMVPINIRRDLGTGIEIDEGPRGGDSVIVGPPASLRDGAQVKVEPDDATGQQGGTPAGGDAKKAGPPASATPGGGDGRPGAPGEPEKEKVSER